MLITFFFNTAFALGPISQSAWPLQWRVCVRFAEFLSFLLVLVFFSKQCRLSWCWHSLACIMCATEPSIFSQVLDTALACAFITECAVLISHTGCTVLVDSSAESFLQHLSQLPCLRCSTTSSLCPCRGTVFLSLLQSELDGGLFLDSSSCLVKVKSGI